MKTFREELIEQRWDDHRFYHHSLVNQSLHFLSACTFLLCYALLFVDPAVASLLAWTVAMWSRQSGHFFFEPKTYDNVNDVTHEYKEEVKVGYNLFRKWVLMGIWAGLPLSLLISPSFFGLFGPAETWWQVARHVGWLWLGLGVFGIIFAWCSSSSSAASRRVSPGAPRSSRTRSTTSSCTARRRAGCCAASGWTTG
jgi:hypothetical protein